LIAKRLMLTKIKQMLTLILRIALDFL